MRVSGQSELAKEGENFAQIVNQRGTVVDSTPGFASHKLLTRHELASATLETNIFDRTSSQDEDPVRLLATPVTAHGQKLVIVVGTSLEDRIGTLDALRRLLLLGGALSLLLAAIAGYAVSATALRPVESMRRRAATISGDEPGVRLPLPAANDELHRLGETLNEMLARLELAVTHERDFVSDASHELRTPLAVLRTELELALRRSRSEAELKAALESALDETVRLVQLAEDLLVLARLDDGELPVNREKLSLTKLLGQTRQLYAERFESAGRVLAIDAQSEIELSADPLRVEQALANLLENAYRHGDGKTTIGGTVDGNTVVIAVEDEGSGFPAEFLPKAFDRFSRASDSRQLAGSGLGLAIVAAIAASHGGSTNAANLSRGGARVDMRLPRVFS